MPRIIFTGWDIIKFLKLPYAGRVRNSAGLVVGLKKIGTSNFAVTVMAALLTSQTDYRETGSWLIVLHKKTDANFHASVLDGTAFKKN